MKKGPATEEALGIALSALIGSEPKGDCLPADMIWALVSKKATGKERDDGLAHLAACDHCRRAFLLASDISSHADAPEAAGSVSPPDEGKVISFFSARRSRVYMPYALAAGLVLAVLSFLIIRSTPQGPVTIAQNHGKEVIHEKPVAPAAGMESIRPPLASSAAPQQPRKHPKSPGHRVLLARIEPDEKLRDFLMNSKEEKITNEKDRVMVLAMVKSSGLNFDDRNIREVRVEQSRTVIKSFMALPKQAEIEIRDGVMTIKLLPGEQEGHVDESR